MTIFLLSFTGVPPLVGFVGKFYLFAGALQAGLVGLVVIAVLNAVMAAYYYIYVIVAMYMQEGGVGSSVDDDAAGPDGDHHDRARGHDPDWNLSGALHDGGDHRIQLRARPRPCPLRVTAALDKKAKPGTPRRRRCCPS